MKIARPADLLLFALFFGASWSCNQEGIEPSPANYFPLENNHTWTYQRRFSAPGPDSSIWFLDTLTLHINGDTVLEGKTYAKMTNELGYTERIIRVEGPLYLARSHERFYYGLNSELFNGYTDEYKFLDTELPVGSSWTSFSRRYNDKLEFVIAAKNSQRTILGKAYEDVVEVDVNYYYQELGQDKYWLTTKQYYAKGIGEIHNFFPSPVSLTYGDLDSFLIH